MSDRKHFDDALKAWTKETDKAQKESNKYTWDVANIAPSDVGVRFGPVLDEEAFKEYKKQKNDRLKVMTMDQLHALMNKK